jgi:hypothetical protein
VLNASGSLKVKFSELRQIMVCRPWKFATLQILAGTENFVGTKVIFPHKFLEELKSSSSLSFKASIDHVIAISCPEKNVAYTMFPGFDDRLHSFGRDYTRCYRYY